jgi:signal peptidase I
MQNAIIKFTILCFFIVFIGIFSLVESSQAATYYVDFENGNDSNSGTATTSPWKHAPGDANATGIPAQKGYLTDPLQPGDIVLFKGGVVYRGSIYMDGRWINGSQANPITYKGDGWGSVKAVLDGSALLPNAWQPCASQASCAGNPHWQNIYYEDISGNYTFDQGFYENDDFLWYSQDPNPADPFVYDRTEYLRVIPQNDPNIHQTRTSMTDPRYFTQSDSAFWNNAHIISWRVPNVMAIKKITSYDPASHTIYYDDLGGDIYADRDSYYSVLNHLSMIDTPGEFYYNETNHRLYVWPRQTPISQESFSVRTLDTGIFNSCASNLNIEGFIVRKFAIGIRAINGGTGITPQNDIIRSNRPPA